MPPDISAYSNVRHPYHTLFCSGEQFKGPHDAVGTDVKEGIKKLEFLGIRSPTAYAAFKNCIDYFDKSEDYTRWKELEKNGDPQLERKGKFGVNTRHFLFAVKTEEQQNKLSLLHHGRIILCDRTNVLEDTHNKKAAFKGAVNVHQVSTIKTASAAAITKQQGRCR